MMDKQEIQRTIDTYIQNQELAGGALLVRRDNEILYQNTFGFADIAAGLPIAEDSIYRLMSMTKPITAVAVMQLVEQGKIQLDASLNHYLHGFTAMRVVDDKRYVYHEGMNALSLTRAADLPAQSAPHRSCGTGHYDPGSVVPRLRAGAGHLWADPHEARSFQT